MTVGAKDEIKMQGERVNQVSNWAIIREIMEGG